MQRPLEDHRPFALVVSRGTPDLSLIARIDVRTSLAGELNRIRSGQIEEPEINRILCVAEDEVWLPVTRRHLHWNLDRDGVGEF